MGGAYVYHFEERSDALVQYGSNGTELMRVLVRPLEPRLRPNVDRIVPPSQAQMLKLYADPLGRAWVEIARDKVDGPRKWWVFDASGKWLAEATSPASFGNFQPFLEVGPDYVLLVKRDRDDVETVAYCPIGGMR